MNYGAIADAAAGKTVDQAFADMSTSTTQQPKQLDQRMINERTVLSVLGLSTGEQFMQAIEASAEIPARVKGWFKPSEMGVDVLDTNAQGIIAAMVAGAVITQAEADSLTAYGYEAQPKWSGVTQGHIKKALDMRARGEI